MSLSGIAADVTREMVQVHLIGRPSDILDEPTAGSPDVFLDQVSGTAAIVVPLTGQDPPPGTLRDLAVQAIAVETASRIEYALFPEQQAAGDVGRGYHLHQLFLEMQGQLAALLGAGAQPGPGARSTGGLPSGRFPPPERYPDPVRTRPWWWCW